LQLAADIGWKGRRGLRPVSAVTVREVGAQVRDSDGRLDDVTAGLVVLDDRRSGEPIPNQKY
jgi:hypothetical protein